MKTIDQLLDEIGNIPISLATEELGVMRQKLIDLKKRHPKGGLTKVMNTKQIEEIINKHKI